MNICRTCLKTPANKDILQLEKVINEDTKNYVDIMMFCLGITVTKDSKITTNLCNNCFSKIISFYKFKSLSLKNDLYLKSLQPGITLDVTKISVYVHENGIKHQNSFEPDDYGPTIVEDCYTNIKKECNIEYETTEAIQSDVDSQSVEENKQCDELKVRIKENVVVDKKKKHSKKRKLSKSVKVEQQRGVCEVCGKAVLNLKQHSRVHQPISERKTVKCKLCPRLFCKKAALDAHHKTHHLGTKLECDICYKKVWRLAAHRRRMHAPHALPLGCAQCGRRCESQHELNIHTLSHTKVLALECDVCHRRFGSKQVILNHILRVHEKQKLHQCHLCPKAYFVKYELNEHLRSHTNERPYKCECGKSYAKKGCLKKHLPSHGDKAFQCQHCAKSFFRLDNLKLHMLTHTKEKKYPCQVCGVRFARSNHRNRHENTVHQKHT